MEINKNLIDYLRNLMNEADMEYLKYVGQLLRNKRRIFNLIKDNKNMDEKMKKTFGRRNNILIRKTEKENAKIMSHLDLKDPFDKFEHECLKNKIDSEKLREIFSEERGWSIIKLYYLV